MAFDSRRREAAPEKFCAFRLPKSDRRFILLR
jgi:hypothetical protein